MTKFWSSRTRTRALSSIPRNVIMPVASMVAAYMADYFGLYPIFVAATVIYYIGLVVLQIGVKIVD